jgi:hypothetical protein
MITDQIHKIVLETVEFESAEILNRRKKSQGAAFRAIVQQLLGYVRFSSAHDPNEFLSSDSNRAISWKAWSIAPAPRADYCVILRRNK